MEMVNPLGALMQAEQIRGARNQNRLADLQYGQTQAKIQDQSRLRSLLPQAIKGDQAAIDQVGQIDPDMFMKLDENQRAAAKERAARLGNLFASVQSVPEELRPLAYNQAAQIAVRDLGIDPAEIKPYDPTQFKLMVDQHRKIEDILKQPPKSAFQEKLDAYKNDPTAREMIGKSGVQINVGGAKKEQEKLAEARVGRFDAMQQDALAAMDMNERLNQLSQIDVKTGFGEGFKADTAAALKSLGVEGAESLLNTNIANAQSFNAVTGDLLIRQMATQKGPQTDRDAQNIRETLPKIGNEAEANKFILSSFKAINQRKIEQAEFYDDYLSENQTLDGADKAWREYKSSTPLVSATVKDASSGLPMFFYDFRQKAMAANPGATDEQIAEAWRKLAQGK